MCRLTHILMIPQRNLILRPMIDLPLLLSLAMDSPGSKNGRREEGPSSGPCAAISSHCAFVLRCCLASIRRPRGAPKNMAYPDNGLRVSSKNLSVSLGIISNFAGSDFSTRRMPLNSDGVGCGGAVGAAARLGRERIAQPVSQRCQRHGCGITPTSHPWTERKSAVPDS